MEKKKYEKPEVEVIILDDKDIITESLATAEIPWWEEEPFEV